MDNSNALLINRFFSKNTFKELIYEGESETYTATIHRYIDDSSKLTTVDCIRIVYRFLQNNYRNEYFYKNTLLNKLLLGIHNLNTTTALTELPVARSKADFLLINGKAIVYEIKTELDNLDRLDGQINDYYKAFTRVVIVSSEDNYDELFRRYKDSPVGICILTKRGTLSMRKEPIEYSDGLLHTIMFKIMRKKEYERILINRYGSLPDVSQFEHYRACLKLYSDIPVYEAYEELIKILKNRMQIDIKEFERVPYELKCLIYFLNLKQDDYSKLARFLKN